MQANEVSSILGRMEGAPRLAETAQPVSVVVVNHNTGRLLAQCVASCLEQVQQVVIVDNVSNDESMILLERAFPSDDRLKVIHAIKNLGYAAGCNIGIKATAAPNVMILNPDCVLGHDVVRQMVSVLEGDTAVGMVGGLLLNPDGTEQGGGRRSNPTPWRTFVRVSGLYRLAGRWPELFPDFHLHNSPLPHGPLEVDAISGALMLVRRDAIEQVGPLDEGYFLHCEDLDWCTRFRRAGWKIMFVPGAPVVHSKGGSSLSRPVLVEWHKHKGMIRYYLKFLRDEYPDTVFWVVSLGVWMRFCVMAAVHSVRSAGRFMGLRRG
jgi:GT2 family glycosyltransferase